MPFLRHRWSPLIAALIATAVISLVFLIWPGLDLWAAGLSYSDTGFEAASNPLLKALRKSSSWAVALTALTALFFLVRAVVRHRLAFVRQAPRAIVSLLGLLIGPGLLVNTLLKNEWGRPRPHEIAPFGGEAPYVPVWQITRWCDDNCSFTSGEGASSAWIVGSVALLPPPWRARLLIPAVIYGAALSINRIAFGGHFLSDVLLSWSMVLAVMAGLYAVIGATRE